VVAAVEGGAGVALREAGEAPASDGGADQLQRPACRQARVSPRSRVWGPGGTFVAVARPLEEVGEEEAVEGGEDEPLRASRRAGDDFDVFDAEASLT
jgi:hypothetical protein